MPDPDARPVDTKRWRLAIVRHLEDLPRQYAALEHAMASFGEDFDLQQFKAAYNTSEDMDAYNRVQAVERALGRVQNYVGELADAGVKLAGLAETGGHAWVGDADRVRGDARRQDHQREALPAGWSRRRTRGHASSTATSRRPPATCIARRSSCGTRLATSSGSYRDWIEPYLAEPEH